MADEKKEGTKAVEKKASNPAPQKKQAISKPKVHKFSKEQLVKSNQFSLVDKAFLDSLLDEEKTYGINEAKQLVNAQKRKVAK